MLLILFSLCISKAQNITGQLAFGGTGYESAEDIIQTNDSGYVITGYTTSFGAGGYDVLLVRTNQFGDTLWSKTFGGSGSDYGKSIQMTNDGGYIIAGYTTSFGAGNYDVYLIKTDGLGNTLWTKTYGGTNDDRGYSVKQTTDNGYIIAGYTRSYGSGNVETYLIKTNTNGDAIWTKAIGTSGFSEYGTSVIQTDDGGYFITCGTIRFVIIKTDDNGNVQWAKLINEVGGFTSAQQLPDQGFIITGHYQSSFGVGLYDVLLVRTDSSGNILWANTYGGIDNDYGTSVQLTSDNGFIIAGHTESFGAGGIDFYMIKENELI